MQVPHASVGTRGVGVIDTSSLWAVATIFYKEEISVYGDPTEVFYNANRELYESQQQYFTFLLHNLILYDELRTDFEVLESEPDGYREAVKRFIAYLSPAVTIKPMPTSITDAEIMLKILPAFLERTRSDLRSAAPSPATEQIVASTQDYWHLQHSRSIDSVYNLMQVLGAHAQAELLALAESDLGPDLQGVDTHAKLSSIVRNLSVLARTMRYSSHSQAIHTQEGLPSAFCASPRRIELLKDYTSSDYMKTMQYGVEGFTDLFARLDLPRSGYDFSGFSHIVKPVSFTDLSLAIADLPPEEALARVLAIRETDEGREVRRIWSERLWAGGTHSVEGYGHQSVRNSTIFGNLIQIIGVPAELLPAWASGNKRPTSRADRRLLSIAKRALFARLNGGSI
jgi:hypothetical protein